MKKWFSLLAFALLLSSLPTTASAAGIIVTLNDQAVVFPDAQPYQSGNDIYIPLRQTAQAMGLSVSFTKSTNQIQLSKAPAVVSFQIGDTEANINGQQSVSFGAAAITKQNRVYVPLSFFSKVFGLEVAYSNHTASIKPAPVAPNATLPASLMEEEIVVGAGTAYPLQGTLTLPKETNGGPLPAVVLVHGSGPSDRDETIYANKPFRDIAWGLAQQGIAVLRYEKRTFAHGKSFTPEMLAAFTVKDETVDDAIAASKLLKEHKRIDASQVYIAGHSLGGMLTPRIDAEGGDFAGLIILAGSTRPLWEISADQNADFIQAMDDKDPAKKVNEAWLEAERQKAKNIPNLTDEEAMTQIVFGMPAYYLKEMNDHNAADIVSKLDKPILVLQGEDDFQVSAKDYALWQEQLKGNPDANFKLYPGLNHLFINYAGEGENTVNEYRHPGNVEPQVIIDMASWINQQQQK